MGRLKYEVRLGARERRRLEALSGDKRNGKRVRTRSKILLMADCGRRGQALSDERIATALRCSERLCWMVRKQFGAEGLQATVTRKRSETPASYLFDAKKEARLLALARSRPPAGRARWTIRMLRQAAVEQKIVSRACGTTIRRALGRAMEGRPASVMGACFPRLGGGS